MIAYNHYIKFIPELKNDKKVEGSFVNTIAVKENSFPNLNEILSYLWIFHNNQGRDITLYADREFSRTVKGQLWAFEIKDVMTFFWYSGALILEYVKHKNFTEALLEYWCLHIVLPLFFTIEETYNFLHASAVEVEGKPILFVAESFGGKSTMTDFFMKQGHMMISDDKVAMYEKDSKFFAVPSHPHHRPYRKMEDIGFFVETFGTRPKPVYVIYELEKTETGAKVEITELQGIEKFKTLRYASEMNIFFLKPKRFEFLMNMANEVAVYKVGVPWNIEKLSEVYSVICEHNKGFK